MRNLPPPPGLISPLWAPRGLKKGGNPVRQPKTRKGRKMGECLLQQEVGRMGTSDVPSQDMPPPTPLCVSGRHFYILLPAAAQQDTLNPKPCEALKP